jgi:3-hydroxymyristoyl/3-hydroxydecanoyl-(acyl carrier protein) dehydratase
MLPADVTDLLPQKTPFKMVDHLHFSEENKIVTSFTVNADNPLVCDGFFTEGGMIENMAQSAAAGTGYFFTQQQKEIPIGYIGAVKNVKISRLPASGDEIRTELTTLNRIGDASIVEGKIFSGKELLGCCELTIFVQQT